MRNNNKGFTLVEVVVTVGTIAILAVVGGISISIWVSKARDAQVVNNVQTVAGGLETYHIKKFEFPEPDGNVLTGNLEQGMIGSGVIKKLSSFVNVKNLSNSNKYIYSTYQIYDHYQIVGLLENDTQIHAYEYMIDKAYANADMIVELGDSQGFIKKGTVESIPIITNKDTKTLVLEGNDGKNGGTTGNYLVINSDLTENEEINEKISGSGDLSEVEKVSDTYFKESGGSISSGASDGGGGSDEIDTPINNPFKDLEYNTGDVIEVNGNNIIYAGTQNRDGEEYILMTYDASDLGDSGRLFKDGTKDKWTKNDGDNWRSCNVYIDCGHMRGGATVFDDMNKNPYIRYTGLFVSKSGEQVWCGDSSIEYCNDASDGDKNTDEIIEFFSNTDKSEEIYPRYTAAEFCRDLRIGGYNDWYLPARQQLSIISTILDKNIRYLSSTEFANNDPNSGNWLYEYNELGGLWTKKSVPWDMSNGGHALLWDEQTLCIRESQ